jgi:predicted Zn-dependent peptidase
MATAVPAGIAEARTRPVAHTSRAASRQPHAQVTELPSGLRVVSERVPTALSVAAGVWVGVGARDEPDELSGVSHFLEHLLFKGTEERSARDIAFAVDRVGGDMNAFTAKEYTAYYCRVPAEHLSLAVELLGEVLTAPALRDSDVENERQVILEELAMDDDLPEDVAHRLLAEAMFPAHPLGRETAGTAATVQTITGDDVRAFFGRWYRPAAMVVAVAGPVDHDAVVAEVERRFAGPGEGDRPERSAPTAPAQGLVVDRRRTEQAQLAMGFRGVSRHDPDREALDVLNHVLGGGLSSRLFEEIREQRGLAYAVGSSTASYADAGALTIYAGTGPSHVGDVLGLIAVELAKLGDDGITEEELDVARGYLTGAYVLGLEDTGSRMARLGALLTVTGQVRTVEDQVSRWRRVSRDDVARAAERVLDQPRSLAVVGPVSAAAVRRANGRRSA